MTNRRAQERAIYESLVYPGSHVLRNKLGITNPIELKKAEAQAVLLREPTRPHFKNFTLQEMQTLHQHLFSGCYEWAGQLRCYTTGRSNLMSFTLPEYIESSFESAVAKPLQREGLLQNTNREQFVVRSAHFANEVNGIHPFIDGNGRVTRFFLQDLALQAGYQIDITRLEANKGAWYQAMQEGFERGKTAKLQREIISAMDGPQIDLTQSAAEMNRIVQQIKAQPLPGGLTAVVESANLKVLTPYTGKIVALTEHHALQQTGANKFVVHARAMSAPQDFQQGKQASIVYGQSRDLTPQTPSAYAKGKQASSQTPAAKSQQTADRSHKGRSR